MNYRFLRRPLCAVLCGVLFLPIVPAVHGAEEEAENISGMERVAEPENVPDASRLFDGDTVHAVTIPGCLTLSDPRGIGSAYLIFDTESGEYTVSDLEKTVTFGQQGFLHEFLDLEAAFGYAPQAVTFSFPEPGAQVNEVYLFTSGKVPDFVQKWKPPKEGETDLMLFSAHGDDEHLFFAGLLPDYAGERGYETLVVYLTNHRNRGTLRCHEMLNGLWAVGVTTYPILGPFHDLFCKTRDRAYALHDSKGESPDELLGFVVEQLRRFRPQVAVGHDIGGEYGHGQHTLFSELLRQGVEAAGDPAQYPGLAQRCGAWQVPKTYLHLWPENPVTLDWDQPLSRFDGMTAFQVSVKLGFACHKSQVGGVTGYITGYGSAADIPKYSPCQYGLYRTTVGPDKGRQDLFENLTSYRQQRLDDAIARNEKASLEAAQAARTFAQIQHQRLDYRQEYRQIQVRMGALSRREALLRLWICLFFSVAALAGAALLFLLLILIFNKKL